jgi:putative aldouronate transport system permease protein
MRYGLTRKNLLLLLGFSGIAAIMGLPWLQWVAITPKPRYAESLSGQSFSLYRLLDTLWAGEPTALTRLFTALAVMLSAALIFLILSMVLKPLRIRKTCAAVGFGLAALAPAIFLGAVILTPFKQMAGLMVDTEQYTVANSDIRLEIFPVLLLVLCVMALILARAQKRSGGIGNSYHNLSYHAMMTPAVVFLVIFSVIPIFGLVIAFKNYQVARPFFGLSSDWNGLKNFEYVFLRLPESRQVIINTVIIAVSKIIGFIVVPVCFALLLNECRVRWLKGVIQTTVYLPNFLSWVTVGLLFRQMFSPIGLVNSILLALGLLSEPVSFITSNDWFRQIVVFTDIWKGFGYSAVIYIAAITSLDPNLYEAASMDGAGRWKRMRYITVPGILPTVILMSTLALGNVLNAGFDQIFNMITLPVRATGDIMDTYIYRIAIEGGAYHRGTAMGMAKSVISMLLIILSYRLADRYAGYRIF